MDRSTQHFIVLYYYRQYIISRLKITRSCLKSIWYYLSSRVFSLDLLNPQTNRFLSCYTVKRSQMYFSSRDHYYCCACTICIRSTKYIGHWQKSLSDESCTCQFGAKSKFWTEKEKRGSVLARWECVCSAYVLGFPTNIQITVLIVDNVNINAIQIGFNFM